MPSTLFLVENAAAPRDPRVWAECRTMREHGWDVTAICPPHPLVKDGTIDGIRVVTFDDVAGRGSARGYVFEYARAMRRIRRLVREVSREHRFDVVHAANPPDFLLATARHHRRRGAGLIFDHHDLSPELFEAKFQRRGIGHRALLVGERIGFGLADVVISANESFRRVAIERGKKHPDDVFVVRNGPDPAVFRPGLSDPLLRGDAKFLIGYAGLMGSQDGIVEAIDALAVLARDRNDWRALFAGDGEMLPRATQRVRELRLDDRVSFVGFVDDREDLVRLLGSCDVCLSPEPPNPLNNKSTLIKVAEYMALGKPIVAFDLPESRLTAGDAAVYARSIDDLGRFIGELLDDEDRRREMGRKGRERVLAGLGWAQSETALLAAYERAAWHARRR